MSKKKAPARPAAPVVDSVTVSLELPVPQRRVFEVVSDANQLPGWAGPIKSVRADGPKPTVDYELPGGRVSCVYGADLDAARGTADWTVHFPDAPPLRVYTRAMPIDDRRSIFTLTLVSPPLGPARAKNAKALMEKNLAQDLERLKTLIGA